MAPGAGGTGAVVAGATAGSGWTALLALTGIRLGLAVAGLGAALAFTSGHAAGLGFAVGAIGCALFVVADPRRRFRAAPRPLPDVPWWRRALRATLPSTVGVAVLCAISLAVSAVLAAVLAGILAGLAIGGLAAAALPD